jgi:hypothetical protein
MSFKGQIAMLLILALPVACVSWTVTHEEVFREVREYFVRHKRRATRFSERKFFYLFTCEYCFSHYVAGFFVAVTRFRLLNSGWVGYLIALFALVWVANNYMTLSGALRSIVQRKHVQAGAQPSLPSSFRRYQRLRARANLTLRQ